MEDFNLVYYHRETEKKYLAKRVTKDDYVILDPEFPDARLRLSAYAINKAYKADKNNSKRQRKVRLNFEKRKDNGGNNI